MYNVISGAVFAVIAIAHLVRALNAWPVQVADWSVSVAVSWVAVVVAGGLSVWAFRAQSKA